MTETLPPPRQRRASKPQKSTQARFTEVVLKVRHRLAICLLGISLPTVAEAITPDQNNNPDYFNIQYGSFISNLETKLTPLLSVSSPYGKYIYTFLIGCTVIYGIYHFLRWVLGSAGLGDLVEKGIYLFFVWGLMGSYSVVTGWIFGGFTQLAGVMQKSILGDDQMLGPAIYLFKVAASLKWDSANFITDGLVTVALYFSTVVLSLLLTIVAALVAAWPVVGYFVSKIVGLALIPTLLIPQLNHLFDGWLRLFFGFALFTLVGRAVLVAIVLIAEVLFSSTYGAAVPVSLLGAIDGIQNVIVADMFFVLGIVFLAATASTVGKITGGGPVNAGVGAAMSAVSRVAAAGLI